MLKNFEDSKSNEEEEFNYNDNLFGNDEDDDELNELNGKMINEANLNCFPCVENNEFSKNQFLQRKRKMQKNNVIKGMKYYDGEEEEEDEEEEKINDKYDDIYDNLILKQDKKNKGKGSSQLHVNEDEDIGGIYLQDIEFTG